MIFHPYLDLEAGDNQSRKIQVARPGIKPRSSCFASQELNHSSNAAPIMDREKGRDLHQFYDKSPIHLQRNQNSNVTTQKRHQQNIHASKGTVRKPSKCLITRITDRLRTISLSHYSYLCRLFTFYELFGNSSLYCFNFFVICIFFNLSIN